MIVSPSSHMMPADELLMQMVSFKRNRYDKKFNVCYLTSALTQAKSIAPGSVSSKEETDRIKGEAPALVPQALFGCADKGTTIDNFKCLTGFALLDFDDIEDMGKAELACRNLESAVCYGRTLSGKGLWCLTSFLHIRDWVGVDARKSATILRAVHNFEVERLGLESSYDDASRSFTAQRTLCCKPVVMDRIVTPLFVKPQPSDWETPAVTVQQQARRPQTPVPNAKYIDQTIASIQALREGSRNTGLFRICASLSTAASNNGWDLSSVFDRIRTACLQTGLPPTEVDGILSRTLRSNP